MKRISTELFQELRRKSSRIVYGWKITLVDGSVLGFTSGDTQFVYDSVTHLPTNAFSASAATSKNNLSVDNMSTVSLINSAMTEQDLRAGKYDNAQVQVFWICPVHPEWGIVPIKGGRFGEVTLKNAQFETEVRALMQLLQQPFGDFYTLECSAVLGDSKCKVPVATTKTWEASHQYIASATADAGIGSVIKTSGGLWYRAKTCRTYYSKVEATTTSTGVSGNSERYLTSIPTDTENGDYPVSAPAGVQVLTITATSETISYAIGVSGTTEPAWGASTVSDGEVVWMLLTPRMVNVAVSGVYNKGEFESTDLGSFALHYFQYGYIEFTSGDNKGRKMEVRDFTLDPRPSLFLLEQMPYRVSVGDRFNITVGCARTRNACKAFDNIHNMRAQPDMPTEDKALTTPNFSEQGTADSQDSGGS